MTTRTYRIATEEQVHKLARMLLLCVEAGKVLRVEVSRWKKRRSTSQNAYLWGVVYAEIADATGHTADEIHEALKQRFCPVQIVRLGENEVRIRSTAKLSTTEFMDYVDQVVAFAAVELGIGIPGPG